MNFFSNFLKYKSLVIIALLVAVPISAYAQEGHHNSPARTLGWVSIGAGMAASMSFMVFNAVKKQPLLKIGVRTEMSKTGYLMYKPLLNFHIMLNSVGFFAGMTHGIMLLRGLDSISLSLAIAMSVSMASGIILRFAPNRNLKFFGRLMHGQIILLVLIIVLVGLHVMTAGEFD